MRIGLLFFLVVNLAVVQLACSATSEHNDVDLLQRVPCDDHQPLKQALFGDLHVHTSYSMDAYIFGSRTSPDQSYRFAKGEAISIAPLDNNGRPTQQVQMERPLDFAAVTDHAENLGSVSLCTNPDSPVYASRGCKAYRGGTGAAQSSFAEIVKMVKQRTMAVTADDVCGEDGRRCRDATYKPWQDTQDAAERHYDRGAGCQFSTFVAYEYSLTPELSKVHRNIIFRNEVALERPIDSIAEPEPLAMLLRLRDECIDGIPGCDVLAIPHNPNLSDGRMFRTDYPGSIGEGTARRMARLRASMEPVVEIMQTKGDSECRNGLIGVSGVDELCRFEKKRSMSPKQPPDCEGGIGAGGLVGKGCVDRNDFVRYALVAGLEEEKRLGVNPFRFGLVASTDEHDGTMGYVEEWNFGDPKGRDQSSWSDNPGGLVGVWAEENSRDAIFDAIRRREVYGTSGPRIEPRFFAGWDMPDDLCSDPNMLATAYANGVPMGGVLDASHAASTAPKFLLSALKDAGTLAHPGNKLQRLQIIKGWVGENGIYQQRVVDVAGSKRGDDDLDLQSCETHGAGHDTLCGVWSDPEFDASQQAVYYSRVVEMPSCRWSTRRCNALPEGERPDACHSPLIPKSIQERAWTSPIWYSPKES